MSWDAYVTNMKAAGAQFCGVYTQTGVVCAQSENFNVTPTEINLIKQCFDKTGSKLEVNGIPCLLIKSDECTITGKSKDICYQDSKILFHCEFTNTLLIIVGMTGAGERKATGVTSNIGSYLKSLGQ